MLVATFFVLELRERRAGRRGRGRACLAACLAVARHTPHVLVVALTVFGRPQLTLGDGATSVKW